MFSRYLNLSLLCAGIAIASILAIASAVAQTYPAQPIKVVIGFGPGSAADVLARVVAKQMEASLDQPVVIENRPGNSNVLVAHPSVPADNLKELIALAKSKPETLTFGSSGYATASYMAAELFNANAGTAIVMVPFQGGSNQALSDLLSGRITVMFNVAATLAPHVAAGKLKAFAVAQSKRARSCPMFRRWPRLA
jgi:tripartite-type tricarboxylate transporter receptor subunit TctC